MLDNREFCFLPINIERDFEICKDFRIQSYIASFGTDKGFYSEVGVEGYKAWLANKIEQDPYSCVHIWFKNRIIGQIEMTVSNQKQIHVNLFFLEETNRGLGYSQHLNKYAEQFAINRGCEQLRLTVSPTNRRAISYYKKMGWIQGGMREGTPEVQYMHKQLDIAEFKKQFYQNAHVFLSELWSCLPSDKNGFGQNIDHLCYSVSSIENYHEIKKNLGSIANFLIESDVNGRPIATYRLHVPVFFKGSTIWEVEVPAPKSGKTYQDGFEHIEIIEPTFEYEVKHQKGLIKYHERSLLSIVNLEKKPVYQIILKTNIINLLKPWSPVIVGTFPLDIETDVSDVDILVEYKDSEDKKKLLNFLKTELLKNPDIHNINVTNDEKNFVFNFIFNKISFEIYGEKISSLQQNAYGHFLVEDRILRLNQNLVKPILNLKKNNIKTEPAFAQYFNLTGEPYQELLNLVNENEIILRQKLKISLYSF